MHVGYIGLGAMGGALARRLLAWPLCSRRWPASSSQTAKLAPLARQQDCFQRSDP